MFAGRRRAGPPRSHAAGPAPADRQRLHAAAACRAGNACTPVTDITRLTGVTRATRGAGIGCVTPGVRGRRRRGRHRRRRRHAVHGPTTTARQRPAPGDAGHVASRLRQPGAVDQRLPAPRAQGPVPRRDGRPGGPRARRAHARRSAGLPGPAGGLVRAAAGRRRHRAQPHRGVAAGRSVRDPLRSRPVAEDLVRRPCRAGTAAADAAARRAAGRAHAARGRAHRPAHRRHRRRAHAHTLAQAAARRAGRHAAAHHGGGGRPRAGRQRRSASAFARAPGAAVPPRMAGPHAGAGRPLRVLAGRAEVRIPARDRARWPHPRPLAARADGGGCRTALSGGCAACRARHARTRARPHRPAAVRGLLPHRRRHRALGAQPGHPVPGPRQRRELGRLLLPGGDGGRPRGAHHAALRAFHQRRTQRAARHRHRLRAPAPRRGHPVRLPQVRPPPRRAARCATSAALWASTSTASRRCRSPSTGSTAAR